MQALSVPVSNSTNLRHGGKFLLKTNTVLCLVHISCSIPMTSRHLCCDILSQRASIFPLLHTGLSMSYMNWKDGHPTKETGECVQISAHDGYAWKDASCTHEINFFCEKGSERTG